MTDYDYNKCEHRFSKTRVDRRRRTLTYSQKCRTCKMRVRVFYRRNLSNSQYIAIFDQLGICLASGVATSKAFGAEDRLNGITQAMTNSVDYETALEDAVK